MMMMLLLALVVRSVEGDLSVTEVDAETSFGEVMGNIPSVSGARAEIVVEYTAEINASLSRDYTLLVSAKEKGDIAFIVNTLGMSSLATIATSKSALKKAGDRVDHVHPLRFLECVFSDEHMKASMHAMANRGWIFAEFMKGFRGSMTEEANRENMKPEFVTDFASKLSIDVVLVNDPISKQEWSALVQVLIDKIPRKTNTGRYDM